MISLFFGGTFLGIALLSVGNQFRGWPVGAFYLFGGSVIVVHFEKRFAIIRAGILAVAGLLIFWLAMTALAALAANGTYGSDQSGMSYFYAENYLVTATLWLLIGVPHRAFMLKLDPDGEGDARRLLLGVVTVAASVLTGSYILILHFGGGPLNGVGTGPLIAGTIFTMFLVAPPYKSLAEACWKRGVHGALPLKRLHRSWGNAMAELDAVLYQRAIHILESNRKPSPEVKKIAQDTNDAARSSSRGGRSSGNGASPTRVRSILTDRSAEKLTPKQRRQIAKKLTPKQRRELARRTAQARQDTAGN